MKVIGLCLLALLIMLPEKAEALSCAPVQWDREAIDRVSIIFEGTVVSEDPITSVHKSVDQNVKFGFSVEKLWKGKMPTGMDKIYVIRNIYWGDGFEMGKSYLVTAMKSEMGYVAALCSFVIPLEDAQDEIEILKDVLKNRNKRENGVGNVGIKIYE